ncbi:MAG TPA: high-affinity nickel-transport family protein, partial [Methylomirabilota bacterium]|nr:high-affinity nickel-transport family protein [Methylomirabilota bacterium]
LGMTAITGLLSLPFTLHAPRLDRARRGLALATGALSLAFGLYLAFQLGVVDGLLLGGSPVWRP